MEVLITYNAIICAVCILVRKRITSVKNLFLYSIIISILGTLGFQTINKYFILGGITDPFILIAVAVQISSSFVLCLIISTIAYLINRGNMKTGTH